MKKKFVVLKNKTDKKPERLLSYDEKYLIAELTQSKNALDAAYSCFENATDPTLQTAASIRSTLPRFATNFF